MELPEFQYHVPNTLLLRYLQDELGCVPWDIPTLNVKDQAEIPLCDGVLAYKYQRMQESYDASNDPQCDCLPDCEYVSYSVETSIYPLNPNIHCEDDGYDLSLANVMLAREMDIPGMDFFQYVQDFFSDAWLEVENFEEFYDVRHEGVNRDKEIFNNCVDRLNKEHAVLHIVIKEPTFLKIVQNIRVGFADKLGIAGGTIGLFTGLSLISVVETGYWITRWLMERMKNMAAQRLEARKTTAAELAQKQESHEMKSW